MLKLFYPWAYVKDVFSIDYEKLRENGYDALIFDIDNTLVHHGYPSNENVDLLFKRLGEMGYRTLLLSDNGVNRIEGFIKNIDTLYISNANKPSKKGYLKALDMLGAKKENTVMIGDQIFTDILGANRCKLPCILVEYMRFDDEINHGKRRNAEKVILDFYNKSNKYKNRLSC